jgi:hypothetical protein
MVQSPPELPEINPYPDVFMKGVMKMTLPVLGSIGSDYQSRLLPWKKSSSVKRMAGYRRMTFMMLDTLREQKRGLPPHLDRR